MHPCKSQSKHIDEFHKLVGDLAAIDTAILDKDHALLLLTSLPSSYDNFVETLIYGRDTLKLEDVVATLNSRELHKMTKAKGDGGERLYVRGRSGRRDMKHDTGGAWSKSQERSNIIRNEDQVFGSGVDGYDNVDVIMAMSVEEYEGGKILLGDGRECRIRGTCKVQVQMTDESSFVLDNVKYVPELRQNLISLGTLKKDGFTMKMQSVKIKVATTKTLKGKKQLGEYQTGWKIKKGIQQQNGLVEETNMTLLAKVRCFLIQSGLSKVFWAEDTTMSTYLVNRSTSSVIGFKTPVDMLEFFGWLASIKQWMLKPVKVKCIFLGYRKGTGSMQVLQGIEFEVKPQEDHTFEVEPHRKVNYVAGSHEVQTQDLIYYYLALDTIYAHESLTFNNIVTCEVISKWKAGLKDNMDARSDVCKTEIWATKGLLDKAKGNVLGMKIVRDQSGNTLRVSQSRFYNRKLVQTLLEGHSILSLEGSISGDYDVEKNGKWSCIYEVGSQEYQMVCTRLDIASADVGMLDKFDRGLQTDVQVFVDFDYTIGSSITVMGRSITRYGLMKHGCAGKAAKEAIWLKRPAIDSGFELKIVAGIATGALSKAIPGLSYVKIQLTITWLLPVYAILVTHVIKINPDSVDKNDPKDVQLQNKDIMYDIASSVEIQKVYEFKRFFDRLKDDDVIVVPHENAQATLGDTNDPFTSISMSKDFADKNIAANDAY
ncbi:zinc finger, CCHC-type containing protein [Tanacetum coccineum]|uniref:Zinc finger, CCHC-type containing protein n=1 Tax=Tanacetum coccineum TaxID=301880 RepID=A0ABQ5GDX0_9ASTR